MYIFLMEVFVYQVCSYNFLYHNYDYMYVFR